PFRPWPKIGQLRAESSASFLQNHRSGSIRISGQLGPEYSVLNAQHVQRADDLIAEEGAVHAHFEDCGGQDLPHFPEATQDEAPSAVGVVYVAGAMPDIQDG